jgi:hypothetical protein
VRTMPWKSTVGALTLLTLFGVLLIGCGSSKTTITTADGKGVVSKDGDQITVKTDQGEIKMESGERAP